MACSVHPKLKPYLEAILDHRFGLERSPATVISTFCGSAGKITTLMGNDEITVDLPFAGQLLRWQFLFDVDDLNIPPQILADDGYFETLSADAVKRHVPCLRLWDGKDPKSLLNLIMELMQLYQASQVDLLKNDARLQRCYFEYETLLGMGFASGNRLEVIVHQSSRDSTVEFYVALKVDVGQLHLPIPDPDHPLVMLLITFRADGKTSVEIHVWGCLEELIGRVIVPSFNGDTALMDYIPDIEETLQRKISRVVDELSKRQHFFCALVRIVEPAILDADAETCSKVVFLLKNANADAICTVYIPIGFPQNPPTIAILKAKQSEKVLSDYFFSSDWSYKKMVQKILQVIREFVL